MVYKRLLWIALLSLSALSEGCLNECPKYSISPLAQQAALVRLRVFSAGVPCATARSGTVEPVRPPLDSSPPFTFSLPPGTYTFVVTAYSDREGKTAIAEGCSQGGSTTIPRTFDLLCTHVDLEALDMIGMSVGDGGGDGGVDASEGCAPLCFSTEMCCGHQCINPGTDVLHCGSCFPCNTFHSQPTCQAGVCQNGCDSDWGDCVVGPNGCETFLTSDTNNCGECGRKCLTCNAKSCTGYAVLDFTAVGSAPGTLATPQPLVVAELDQEALHPDVAILHPGSAQISLFSGTSGPEFQPRYVLKFDSLDTNPGALMAGDFANDPGKRVDLAVRTNKYVLVYRNDSANGNMVFTVMPAVNVGLANSSILAAGDFDTDGKLDLITAVASNQIAIVPGKGDGTFGTPMQPVTLPGEVGALIVARFNSDAYDDVAFALPGQKAVGVMLGQGKGGFQSSTQTNLAITPVALVAQDFDRDKKMDLAVLGQEGSVEVRLGMGDGHFAASSGSIAFASAGTQASGFLSADFNLDGNWDLLGGTQGADVVVLLGKAGGSFSQSPQHFSSSPLAVGVGDLDSDQRIDLVLTHASNQLRTLRNTSHP